MGLAQGVLNTGHAPPTTGKMRGPQELYFKRNMCLPLGFDENLAKKYISTFYFN